MLYIVAIAFCALSVPEEQCTFSLSQNFERHWVYRPNRDLCVEYARQLVAAAEARAKGLYARAYCVRAEAFQHAETAVIR